MNFPVLEHDLMQLLLLLFNCTAVEVKSSQKLKMTVQVSEQVCIYISLKKYKNTKKVGLYSSQQFCLFNTAYTVFIADDVAPDKMCEPENAALFKIVLKFISKNKPLML